MRPYEEAPQKEGRQVGRYYGKVGKNYREIGDLPTTDRIMRDAFWLSVYPGITEEMIGYIENAARFIVDKVHLRIM